MLDDVVPWIGETDYPGFLRLLPTLPEAYARWLGRHYEEVIQRQARGVLVQQVPISLLEFQEHLRSLGVRVAVEQHLWNCAKIKAGRNPDAVADPP